MTRLIFLIGESAAHFSLWIPILVGRSHELARIRAILAELSGRPSLTAARMVTKPSTGGPAEPGTSSPGSTAGHLLHTVPKAETEALALSVLDRVSAAELRLTGAAQVHVHGCGVWGG